MTKTIVSLLVIFCACLCSCKKAGPEQKQPVPITLTSFPLATGNAWKYHTLQTSVLDSITEHTTFDTYWEVLTDTLIGGDTAYKMLQQRYVQNSDEVQFKFHAYYANNGSGFYKVAHEGFGGSFYFKDAPDLLPGLSFMTPPASGTNGVVSLLLPPNLLVKFPTIPDDEWISYDFSVPYIKRKWLGYETVTTPAGTFDCIKLQVIFDSDNDGLPDKDRETVFQYFSAKGLVRESTSGILFTVNGETGIAVKNTDLMEVNF